MVLDGFETPIFPKNGGSYSLLDKTSIWLQTGLDLVFRKP